jgi:hypothetical protein
MPKYVVERQYLLPVYQRLVIEADTVEEACEKAVDHDDYPRPGGNRRRQAHRHGCQSQSRRSKWWRPRMPPGWRCQATVFDAGSPSEPVRAAPRPIILSCALFD